MELKYAEANGEFIFCRDLTEQEIEDEKKNNSTDSDTEPDQGGEGE